MPDNTHQIMRQILELNFSTTDQFSDLQQLAARVLKNQGLTTMETVFNRLASPHEQVQLDRLELDLGSLRGPDWPEQFRQRLEEQLEYQLEKALKNGTSTTVSAVTDRLFEQFLYFCHRGHLPWWGHQPSANWMEQILTTLTSAQWQTLTDQVRYDRRMQKRLIYTVSDNSLQTILQQFGQLPEADRVRQQLKLSDWSPTTQAIWREQFWSIALTHTPIRTAATGISLMRQLLTEWQRLRERSPQGSSPNITHTPSTQDSLNLTILDVPSSLPSPWNTWLEQVVSASTSAKPVVPSNQSSSDQQPSLDRLLSTEQIVDSSELNPSQPSTPELASPNSPSIADGENTTGPSDGSPSTTLSDALANPDATDKLTPDPPFQQTNDADPALPLPSDTSPQDITNALPLETHRQQISPAFSLSPPSGNNSDIRREDVYIDAAGMVILHPFLQELFTSLDLLNDQQFYDIVAQRRAVALLTYLAFGNIAVQEYELLLPKLLVNWPWAEPLPPYDLTKPEQLACDELMAAVLRHWSALRSSSADWLREAFFWRDGKLTPVDGGWRLTIEHHAQDILLNRLPWGLGIIRLPWMSDFLYVSWIS